MQYQCDFLEESGRGHVQRRIGHATGTGKFSKVLDPHGDRSDCVHGFCLLAWMVVSALSETEICAEVGRTFLAVDSPWHARIGCGVAPAVTWSCQARSLPARIYP